jgi:hypothetical protein
VKSRLFRSAAAGALLLVAAGLRAQVPLKQALKDEVAAHWIYDDWGRAVEVAKAEKKPILALLRCVP